MRIGLDFDGIVIDYEKYIWAYAALHDMEVVKKGVVNPDAIYFQHKHGWTPEENYEFIKREFVKNTPRSPLMPLAKEMLKRLHDEGHEIFIISARNFPGNKAMVDEAKKVLKRNKIHVDGWLNGVMISDKMIWKMDKAKTCTQNNIDVLIEDNPDSVGRCLDAGVPCILLRDYMANHWTQLPKHKLLQIVDNWVEIYQAVGRVVAGRTL
jgi:uncharacterized HAD superfamily protein